MQRTRVAATALVAACTLAAGAAQAQPAPAKVDGETFGGMEARAIGPAAMGGRISAIDAVAGERLTIYVGAASGGVWKSVDGGVRFKPVFDKHAQSVGAIAIDPSNPKTVWVGTGETWVRNSVSVGDGLYKSTDGGDTWQRVGLAQSERIARIAVDPRNGDTVLACALGHLFDDHPERGVYRTTDGGKTWARTLGVADDTGCADLAMDPKDPQTVYAAMWQVRRQPWFFTSGGPRSGLFKSTDGGLTWQPIRGGLPSGDLGRIAVAVAPSKPAVVYATVESARTALYRSADAGASWTEVSTTAEVTRRPFYFSLVVVDPANPDRVYKPGLLFAVSEDGGRTFSGSGVGGGGNYHPDIHALWVNPRDPEELLLGTDGGLYHSYDRGNAWRFAGALPISQFYHVSYDLAFPYNVYGGLQDNNTWYGPSRRSGGIRNADWQSLTGGDGFWAFVAPDDPDYVYSEYQGGNLFRTRKSTGEQKDIKPSPGEGEPKYRFNWNTPIHLSPSERGTIYYGAQFLFRSRDRGESWERISPDLTTNDPAKLKQDESGGLTLDNSTAENHCTIFAIAESPRNPRVIWVGTDDGQVQVTRDGGTTWTNVTANVPGLPPNTWVSSIEAGHGAEGTAYATFDGHMTGDMRPWVFRTTDFGQSWQSLVTPDLKGYAHVVREDPVNAGLLFLGTESGLFASLDGGAQWGQFTANLPNVAVRDLVIHPGEHDLVIATHGRGLYIVDDITPLRTLGPDVLERDAAILDARPQVAFTAAAGSATANGDAEFVGRSLGESAFITYYLKRRHMFGDLKLEVFAPDGTLLSTIPGSKRRGINRVAWPMRAKGPRLPAGAGIIPSMGAFVGPKALPGVYRVKLIKGNDTYEGEVRLAPDPRSAHDDADRAAQQALVGELFTLAERMTYTVESIAEARDQARARAAALPPGDRLRPRLETLAGTFDAQRKALVASKEGEGISGEEKLREELGVLYGNVNAYEGRPTESQRRRMAVLAKQLDTADAAFDATLAREAAALNRDLARRNLAPIARPTRAEWDARGAR